MKKPVVLVHPQVAHHPQMANGKWRIGFPVNRAMAFANAGASAVKVTTAYGGVGIKPWVSTTEPSVDPVRNFFASVYSAE